MAAAAAAPNLSAAGLVVSDAQLKDNKDFQALHTKYSPAASDATVEATAKAFNEKKFKATVVNDAKAAVDLVASLVPQNASVGFGYSTTFNEIGLNDYFKTRKDLHNFREIALAAEAKGDWGAAGAARAQGCAADYFLTSANAITESGDLVFADLTGTRVPGVLSGKNVIIVVGSNKIVKSYQDGLARLENYVLPLESARVRVVFKVPASATNNIVGVKGSNPFGAPGRIHVVIIKGQYGF